MIALCIAGSALYGVISYKLHAYRAQEALQKMCALDPMTRVNNKPTFIFLAESFLSRAARGGHALAVCDFDDFKQINDNYGHHIGDEVLNLFAAKLHALVDDDEDIIAGRFGGDEFVLFFKRYDDIQHIVQKLASLTVIPGFDFEVTCSIGLSFSDSGEAVFDQYFEAADRSLYKVKTEKTGTIGIADVDAEQLSVEITN